MYCAIPIEIARRELEGQIYLALHLAARGTPTLLGERGDVEQLCFSRQGDFVFLDKGLAYYREEFYKELVKRGGKIVELQAEGLAYVAPGFNPKDWGQLGPIEPYFDALFVWGQKQKPRAQARLSEAKREQVFVTGHPAFDLLLPQFQPYYFAQELTQKYGEDFILFNSNFGCRYTAVSFNEYKEYVNTGSSLYSEEKYEYFQQQCVFEEQYVTKVKELAFALASISPNRKIVYRPHPVENVQLLVDEFAAHSNVIVTNEGGVRSWIASASMVIQKDCTTGLEALMMGTPVISFQPLEPVVESAYGILATSTKEVLSTIEAVDAGGWSEEKRLDLLQNAAPILENITKSAAATITQWIMETYAPNGAGEEARPNAISFKRRIRRVLSRIKRACIATMRPKSETAVLWRLRKIKFPHGTLTPEKISSIINRMRDVQPELPQVDIIQVDVNAVFIFPRLAESFKKLF